MANTWIFHSELFIGTEGLLAAGGYEGLGTRAEPESIVAFGYADDGSAISQMRPEKHHVPVVVANHSGVMDRLYRIRHVVLRQNGVAFVSTDDRLFSHWHIAFNLDPPTSNRSFQKSAPPLAAGAASLIDWGTSGKWYLNLTFSDSSTRVRLVMGVSFQKRGIECVVLA
jgi:hypothetical protein